MGSYHSQYENYYKGLSNGALYHGLKSPYYNGQGRSKKKEGLFSKKRLIRRFEIELIGTLTLFILAFSCKLVVTPETKAVYSYAKSIANKNYDYYAIWKRVSSINVNDMEAYSKNIDFSNIQDQSIDWIEKLKTEFFGGKTVKDKIKDDFSLPLQGKISIPFGNVKNPVDGKVEAHKGVDIEASENAEIKAPYSGTVKEVGEDKQLGKYLIIDHGNGIETKYGNLSSVNVKQGDKVTEAQVIAKCGSTGESAAPHLHFELIYMGENIDPQEYLSF